MRKTASRKPVKAKSRRTKKPRTIRFPLTVEFQDMRVKYKPYSSGGYGQFEFRSPHTPPRRIPVSETGYRCAFAPLDEIRDAPTVQDYARQLALSLMREKQRPQRQNHDAAQLSLF